MPGRGRFGLQVSNNKNDNNEMFTSGVYAPTLLLLSSQRHVTFGGVTPSRNDLVPTCTFIQLSSTSAGVKNRRNCVIMLQQYAKKKFFFFSHTIVCAYMESRCPDIQHK